MKTNKNIVDKHKIIIERINYIVNVFNKMNQTAAFEKWFREHFKLLIVK